LLGQQPGFGKRGRRDSDVSHAPGIEQVVDTFRNQGVKLDHHGADRLLVALEQVDCPDPLLGRGVQPCALGTLLEDPFFRLHRGHQLGLDAPIELGPVFFRDVGCRPDNVLSQPECIERRLR
jgi:hypothetical protein